MTASSVSARFTWGSNGVALRRGGYGVLRDDWHPRTLAPQVDWRFVGRPMLIVVAKGADLVAQRIRETARENDVPVVENPPLARALYAGVDRDQEIPPEHCRAVAEIISYLFRRKGKVRPK